jgi:hypothetical protein
VPAHCLPVPAPLLSHLVPAHYSPIPASSYCRISHQRIVCQFWLIAIFISSTSTLLNYKLHPITFLHFAPLDSSVP